MTLKENKRVPGQTSEPDMVNAIPGSVISKLLL